MTREEVVQKIVTALTKADPEEFESDANNGGQTRALGLAEAIADELQA